MFDQVEIDSDIFQPADSWTLTIYNVPALPMNGFKAGRPIQLVEANTRQTVLVGFIDTVDEELTDGQHLVELSGRDLTGWLVDVSLPLEKSGRYINFLDLVKDYVLWSDGNVNDNRLMSPIAAVLPDAGITEAQLRASSFAVEPGESIWTAVQKAAESMGYYAWSEPDGTIRIGNPFNNTQQTSNKPDKTPVLRLMRSNDGRRNNVLALHHHRDAADLFSEVRVVGQHPEDGKPRATNSFSGRAANPLNRTRTLTNDAPVDFSGSARSSTQNPYPRLKIIVDSQCDDSQMATAKAEKIMADAIMHSYQIRATMIGWIVQGRVWQPGWTVRLETDVLPPGHPRDWVITRRTLIKNEQQGTVTELTLMPAGVWRQPVARPVTMAHKITDAEKQARKDERRAAARARAEKRKRERANTKAASSKLRAATKAKRQAERTAKKNAEKQARERQALAEIRQAVRGM